MTNIISDSERLKKIRDKYIRQSDTDLSGRPSNGLNDIAFLLKQLDRQEEKRDNERKFWLDFAEKKALESNDAQREVIALRKDLEDKK